MGLIKTAGIVTRTVKYGDTSLIVTIVTKELGKVSAIANGARSGKSRMLAGLQLFAYSEFVVYKSKSKKGLYHINEVTVAESFSSIREDLFKLAYASYFAEVLNCALAEEVPDEELLRLFLNTLFVLDREIEDREKIKTVFEWRLAKETGVAPMIDCCSVCGARASRYLVLSAGTVMCEGCVKAHSGAVELSAAMLKIISHIINSDSRNIFAFSAGTETIKYLSRVSELYIRLQLEREFQTLDYLKNVTALEGS